MKMNSSSTTSKPTAAWDSLTIIAFLGLLWLPSLDHFFSLDHAPAPSENRLLAKRPVFKGLGESRDFIAGVENYFNDHFGFRKRLIRLNHHWKEQLFHVAGNPDAIVGRDGWLFYAGMRMLEHCTHEAQLTEQELEDWRRLLEMRRDWLQARGIKYLYVIPPDKHTIYPEFLPQWIEVGPRPRKVQQFTRYMRDHSTVEVLDLSQTLLEGKKIRVAYLTTDAHWNRFGAFVGYRALVQALARQIPGLQPLALDTYNWQPVPGNLGDIYTIMGSVGSYTETANLQPTPRPEPKLVYEPQRFPPHHGSPGTRSCFTLNEKASGKALVFHDSFACSWYAFLDQHFREVVYVWQYDWDRALIEKEKPDVVIDEMLERFFNVSDPIELARKDRASEANASRASR
jgi:alginate O-acetyltransferase complex protein AlgJ